MSEILSSDGDQSTGMLIPISGLLDMLIPIGKAPFINISGKKIKN
jgi:hypothetical protein